MGTLSRLTMGVLSRSLFTHLILRYPLSRSLLIQSLEGISIALTMRSIDRSVDSHRFPIRR